MDDMFGKPKTNPAGGRFEPPRNPPTTTSAGGSYEEPFNSNGEHLSRSEIERMVFQLITPVTIQATINATPHSASYEATFLNGFKVPLKRANETFDGFVVHLPGITRLAEGSTINLNTPDRNYQFQISNPIHRRQDLMLLVTQSGDFHEVGEIDPIAIPLIAEAAVSLS